MLNRNLSSDERPKVMHIPNSDLAYVYQRYKEVNYD